MPESQPTVAVLGTWGYCGLLEDAEQVHIDTPCGPTSDQVAVGTAGDRKLADLTRTGRHRNIPRTGAWCSSSRSAARRRIR